MRFLFVPAISRCTISVYSLRNPSFAVTYNINKIIEIFVIADSRNKSLSVNEQTGPTSLSFNNYMDHIISAVKGSG
jgi:hypothetical protein